MFLYEQGRFNPNDYPDDDIVYDGCNCGNAHFTILSDGACYACRRMESKVGNSLIDIDNHKTDGKTVIKV